jgi:hypothetical protein
VRQERVDTDGMLDRCDCGARAKFVYDCEHQPTARSVDCTECPETTGWVVSEVAAMIRWNKARRGDQ